MTTADIQKQILKIKKIIKSQGEQDKSTISKLKTQLADIDKNVSKVARLSNKIKGEKLQSQKGGGCPYLKDIVAGKKRKKRRKEKGGSCSYHKKKRKN